MSKKSDYANQKILVVEDEPQLRESLITTLQNLSFEVDSAADGTIASQKLKESVYDILLTDLRIPGISGEEIVNQARSLYPDLIIIVATGFGDVRSAVSVMKMGASDYIQKPFLKDELLLRIERCMEDRRLRWESRELTQYSQHHNLKDLIGDSSAMMKIKEMVSNVSGMRTTVLILGETGTGKEVVARAIHHNSPRQDRPLVAVNCGAIPSALLEDEFFGHERGAFTGAQNVRIGRFEEANRGTIFLDEIGNMPLDLQSKLLRVLQERECQRIGGSQTIRLDVRFIAATNAHIENKVKSGEFREDLFYRLNVFPINLPPLRERREDIVTLVPHLLKKICSQEGIASKEVTQEAIRRLQQYHWPGNVRQLENALEMAIILSANRDYLIPQDFPGIGASEQPDNFPNVHISEEGVDFNNLVSEFEKSLIMGGLRMAGGKRSKAAVLLNMKRTTLLEKLKKLQLTEA